MICFQNAGKFVLKDIELHIPAGVAVGIIGASGAGKTTLLKLVSGLLESDMGLVRTMGKNPVKERRQLSTCLRAYFAEHIYFQEEETVRCQFQLMEALYPCDRDMFLKEYRMLERQFHFAEYVDKLVKQLSLGQRRRVELAAVLIGEFGLYLFDEPVNGLDEQGKRVFWKQLQRKKESGATILGSLFVVSAFLGYGVLWTISLVTQMLSFWLMNVWSIVTIKNVFINVLSGSMIPLWFMPDWMNGVIRFTPFSSIYFTPVQIYMGRLSYHEILTQCLIQILWIVIVYVFGNFLWIKGQKKLVVQGG